MFKRVGKVIMYLAVFIAVLEIAIGVIVGFIFLSNGILAIVGIAIIISSIVSALFSNILLFAFGQIVEDVHTISDRIDIILNQKQNWNQITPQYYQQPVLSQYYQPPTPLHNDVNSQNSTNNL